MAYVACGRLDGYWEFELQAWDWLGGKLLVEAAGGVVTQCNGEPSTLNSPSVLAGGAAVHGALQALLP
jgi:myo-inositol-1(or 4)-monophosphatase